MAVPRRSSSPGRGRSEPVLRVVWRQLPVSQIELEQTARDVVQTLLNERQRRLDAPRLIGTRASEGPTTQSGEPLSYALGEERIVGLEWSDPAGRNLRLRLSGGGTLDVKTRAPGCSRPRVGGMSEALPDPRRKAPAIKVRTGSRRRSTVDPALGLEELLGCEVVWQPGSDGSWVAIVPRNPNGNGVGCARLSGDDGNETLATQVEGLLSLEERRSELCYRHLILATDMSGTRMVRADPLISPAPGVAERDDMTYLDRFIQQGWVEEIAFWSVDRIARKPLPAYTLYERWQQDDIGLWLVVRGERMNWDDDELVLGLLTVTSSQERKSIIARTRAGLLRKGPLAGNGHLHSCPTFFRRDELGRVEEDPVCWKWLLRIFELADDGLGETPSIGASTRQIEATLAAEGYEIDHDRIRTILEDPIYVTGEWTCRVSGIEIPQKPIELKQPVPSDRFERVQDWLALRRGGSENTPLGECIFNYVDTVHRQCQDEIGGVNQRRIRIRGYNLTHIKGENRSDLRHNPVVPACCKGKGRGKGGAWTWPQKALERASVLKIREIATHPELLRQLSLAERHEVASTSARLSESERAELEQQLESLVQQRQAATDLWIENCDPNETPDFEDFQRLDSGYTRRITALERRLKVDATLAAVGQTGERGTPYEERLASFLEIMTVDTPSDPRLKALRARLFSLIVSRVVIDDDGRGPITLTLESNLVPPGSPTELGNPVHAAGDFLERWRDEKAGRLGHEERVLERADAVKTDFEQSHSKSVSTIVPELLKMPSAVSLQKMRRRSLRYRNWHITNPRDEGFPVWRAAVVLGQEEMLAVVRLTEAEQAIVSALRPGTIVSTSQLLASTDETGLPTGERRWALIALERRGWLEHVVVDGVGVWAVTDEVASFFVSPPLYQAHAQVRRRGGPPAGPADETRIAVRRGQYQRRQTRRATEALTQSLPVCEVVSLTGMTTNGLLAAVRAKHLLGCVTPDGELRFPRWQFEDDGTVRSEVPAIIVLAEEYALWPWSLHRLLTRERDYGRKPPLASLLEQPASRPAAGREEAMAEISAAIEREAGFARSARSRRNRSCAEHEPLPEDCRPTDGNRATVDS